jgi:xylulokinase
MGVQPPGWGELDGLAQAVESRVDDPIFVPHLAGRVSPSEPGLRGAWVGLTWSHGPGHLYRAVLEGVAFEYAIYLRSLDSLYGTGRAAEVRVTGGGERSTLWNRIKANVLGLPVLQVSGAGGAHRGAALLAGYGVGVHHDLDDAAATWVATGAATPPEPGAVAASRARLARYEAFVRALCGVRG